MGLRDLIRYSLVKVSGADGFSVRGFSPNDALTLYLRHTGELSALFDEYAGKAKGKQQVQTADLVAQLGTGLVSGTPRIMAEIIVIATDMKPSDDEFDAEVEAAMKLSAGVQLDALKKVADLTFTSEMPPGKFLAVVVQLAKGVAAAPVLQAA